MHPAIKLRHVRAFLEIAASASLTAAAKAQGISQPALSRTLAELEALLGVAMFRREGRRLVLTEAGALFRRHASLGLQALDAGAAALSPDHRGERLRVGVLPTVASRLFPRVALALRELSPETVLTVSTGPHAYLLRLLREGRIDLMLGRMPAAAEMADLSFEHLYEEEVVLAARAGHPLAAGTAAEVLRRCPVILPPEDAIIRHGVDDYLAAQGLAGLRPAVETVALALGRGLVLGSDAVWFISRGVILDELDRGEIVLLDTGARFLSGAVGLTRRATGVPPRGVEALAEFTRAAVRDGLHL